MSIVILFALAVAVPAVSPSVDQFDTKHTNKSLFSGDVMVFVGGDTHETGQLIFQWNRALRAALPKGTRVLGVANLSRLPFFVPKSAVKSGAREKNPKTPVLMDWDGVAFKQLGFRGGIIEVRVYNSAGDLVGNVTGSATETRTKMVLDLVAKAGKSTSK